MYNSDDAISVVEAPSHARTQPVLLWAATGAVFLLTQVYVYVSWVRSADFRPTAPGSDPVPGTVLTIIHVYEVINTVIAGLALAWFVWGIVRTRQIDSIRLLMVGWLSAYWLDPWLDFLRPMFTYNAYAVNFGCWCEFIPGWQSANGARIAEPLLIDPSAYFYNFAGVAALALWAMQRTLRRWPEASMWRLGLSGFAAIWVSMGILDIVATRYMGFDAWPIAFQRVSFWGGHYYQFPIYEFILFPSTFVACAFILLCKNIRGETLIERGVQQIRSSGLRTLLRVLAFVAFCNLANLTYTTAMGLHAVVADGWPKDMPSWLSDEQVAR